MKNSPIWDTDLAKDALIDAFKKLHPKVLVKSPVMLVVEVGSFLTTVAFCGQLGHQIFTTGFKSGINGGFRDIFFTGQISLWLWFTVLFANFAEAMAEGRGKAQAESLKRTRTETQAKRKTKNGEVELIPSSLLKKGDLVVVEASEVIPADGTVVEGIASVDESAITGESAPVIREAGGDRSAVTGGTTVLSDSILVQITTNPGESFLDRMIALVEGAVRQKTPNEIALNILLVGLTLVFLMTTVTLKPFAIFSQTPISIVILVALLVCLIPTTIGGLLSAIGIAGMDRLVQRNVLAMSGRAVEASGDIDILLLDKTGTITIGNRMASRFVPAPGIPEKRLAEAAYLSSLSDLTPEGRSIVALAEKLDVKTLQPKNSHFIQFSAETRISGIDYPGHSIRKGPLDTIARWVQSIAKKEVPYQVHNTVAEIANDGGTPLVIAENGVTLGVIHLKDVVKPGIKDRFERIRTIGIRTVMITGDNRLTAAAIAKEAGVDDFLAEARPEDKLRLIKTYQMEGRMVAMSGDGTNDAPALAQSDVGLVMNTGTQAAREAGNMIDLDSDPTKIIEIVEIGKQLLITRGSLTSFSIANDVSKYFAIIPAIFAGSLPELARLNVMNLKSPQSAILSAVIFNAVIIILLIPLALRGVSYRPRSPVKILQRNILVYGVGGLIVPFIGIKLIDMLISNLGLA